MFRRRPGKPGGPGRRPGKPGGPGRTGKPIGKPMQRLIHAHRLMDEGQYLQAAGLFNNLVQAAVNRQLPRAPFLMIQAGRSYLYGGQKSKGTVFVKRGLNMLAGAGRWGELYRVGHRLVEELNEKGFDEESTRLEEWLKDTLPEESEQVTKIEVEMEKQRPILPTNCPHCGGIINSQEVAWMDEVTAECLYCGGAVRAET